MSLVIASVLIVMAAALAPGRAAANAPKDDGMRGHYFMVVWAYEGSGNSPKDSHSFISFYDGDHLADGRVRPATISWLPSGGVVHPLRIERGHNFSLAQTLAMACKSGKQLRRFGPYEIEPGLYQRGLRRIRLLRSGAVAYSAINGPGRMNCIKAAGDLIERPFNAGSSWGSAASKAIVRHLAPYVKGEDYLMPKIPTRDACR